MLNRGRFRLLVLYLVLVTAAAEDQCPVTKNNCECNFSSDAEDGGEQIAANVAGKSEVLAAAVGAMIPLLIGGAGLGIWKLLKRGGDESMGIDRSASDISSGSSPRSLPPKYSSRSGSVLSMTEDVGSNNETPSTLGQGAPVRPMNNINAWRF